MVTHSLTRLESKKQTFHCKTGRWHDGMMAEEVQRLVLTYHSNYDNFFGSHYSCPSQLVRPKLGAWIFFFSAPSLIIY